MTYGECWHGVGTTVERNDNAEELGRRQIKDAIETSTLGAKEMVVIADAGLQTPALSPAINAASCRPALIPFANRAYIVI